MLSGSQGAQGTETVDLPRIYGRIGCLSFTKMDVSVLSLNSGCPDQPRYSDLQRLMAALFWSLILSVQVGENALYTQTHVNNTAPRGNELSAMWVVNIFYTTLALTWSVHAHLGRGGSTAACRR